MLDGAIPRAHEHAGTGMLAAVCILEVKIGFEWRSRARYQPQSVPAARAASFAQLTDAHLCDDGEVDALPQMARHSIEPVDPERAHGARFLLRASVHVLVNDQWLGGVR